MKQFVILFLLIISFNLIAEDTNQSLSSSTNAVTTASSSSEGYIINSELMDTFKYGTTSQKISAISRIKKTKNENDISAMVEYYPNEKNNKIKIAIINFFKQNVNDKGKTIIDYAIVDEDDSVRKEAYYLCSIYPDIKYESSIMSSISNESGLILDSMINALGSIKSTLASDYLAEKYTNDVIGSSTKIEILRYFSETKDIKGEIICRNVAQNTGEPALVRYMGIVAMGAYPSAENYEILQKILKEDLPEVTARVIYILPEYSAYGDIKKDIVEACKNDSESVRIYAIKALDNYKTEPEIQELLLYRLQNDNSENITLEVLNLYSDSMPTGEMFDAIKKLADSSANKKIKDKAKSIVEGSNNTTTETTTANAY